MKYEKLEICMFEGTAETLDEYIDANSQEGLVVGQCKTHLIDEQFKTKWCKHCVLNVRNKDRQKLERLKEVLLKARKEPLSKKLAVFRDRVSKDIPLYVLEALDFLIESLDKP